MWCQKGVPVGPTGTSCDALAERRLGSPQIAGARGCGPPRPATAATRGLRQRCAPASAQGMMAERDTCVSQTQARARAAMTQNFAALDYFGTSMLFSHSQCSQNRSCERAFNDACASLTPPKGHQQRERERETRRLY